MKNTVKNSLVLQDAIHQLILDIAYFKVESIKAKAAIVALRKVEEEEEEEEEEKIS